MSGQTALSALILSIPFCDRLLDDAIEEGTHAAWHGLVSLMSPGTIGPTGMAQMQAAWTAAKRTRAIDEYVPDHFRDYTDVSAYSTNVGLGIVPPRGMGPRFQSAVDEVIWDGCPRCFRFFVGKRIINADGYDHWGRSYLKLAIDGQKWELAAQILHLLPPAAFDDFLAVEVSPYAPVPLASRIRIFPAIAADARLTSIWVEKRYNHEMMLPAAITPIPGEADGGRATRNKVVRWIDARTAEMLYAMSFDVSVRTIGGVQDPGARFSNEIIHRHNPHRWSLMKWMSGKNGKPGLNDAVIPTGIVVNASRWPLWYVAISRGDRALASQFSGDPTVDPLVIGWHDAVNGTPLSPHSIGRAVVYQLNHHGVSMLRQWLFRARAHPGYAQFIPHLFTLMRQIFIAISVARANLGLAGLTSRVRADRRKSVLKIGYEMIRLIIEESVRQIRNKSARPGDGYLRTLAELPQYRGWVAQMKSQRTLMPDVAELFRLIEQPTGMCTRRLRG